MLDDVEPLPRDPLAPFRMSVIDRYKDMGTIAMGKSEAGLVRKGDRLYVMPNKRAFPSCLAHPLCASAFVFDHAQRCRIHRIHSVPASKMPK